MKILNYILSVMLLMFCLPAAAWAEQVPAVTEAEYRYYLEYYARNYLEETDYRSYDDTQLRAMLIENVEQSAEFSQYAAMLRYELQMLYGYEPSSQLEACSEEQLEQLVAHNLTERLYTELATQLQNRYQVQVKEGQYTPQQLSALYYRTMLEQDYAQYSSGDSLSAMTWYQLEQLYVRYEKIQEIQDTYQITGDLSGYTIERLDDLQYWLYTEHRLQEDCGYTGDVSGYTIQELEQLYDRCLKIHYLQEEYGTAEDLSDYSLEQLNALERRLTVESYLRDYYEVQKDFSLYSTEELEQMLQQLAEPVNNPQTGQLDIQVNGISLYQHNENAEAEMLPIMRQERVYVPFRLVSEALGADVSWDAAAQKVSAACDGVTISFQVGQSRYEINGAVQSLERAPFVQKGCTYVPVRFAAETLGAAVRWDYDNNTVLIEKV